MSRFTAPAKITVGTTCEWRSAVWESDMPEDELLLFSGGITVHGVGLHVYAGRAHPDRTLVRFRDARLEEWFMGPLQKMYEGAYEFAEINGNPYIVWAVPYAD